VKGAAIITTSWDDGHPLDLRLAGLLAKYGLSGTFYVPRTAATGTMTPAEVRALSESFEIGAHTLDHTVLTRVSGEQAWAQIAGSKCWVEDVTGQHCRMFCPPRGKYRPQHVRMARTAGFMALRSVELGSLARPRAKSGILVMPTTVQAHPQGLCAVVRNALKRAAFANLWRMAASGAARDWPALARSLVCRAVAQGGVFHLWGHSWEIDQAGQWRELDEVLRFMGGFAPGARAVSNGQVCDEACAGPADVLAK